MNNKNPSKVEVAYWKWCAYQDIERMFGNDSDLMDFVEYANVRLGVAKADAQEYLDALP
jgi:hypothetical protein